MNNDNFHSLRDLQMFQRSAIEWVEWCFVLLCVHIYVLFISFFVLFIGRQRNVIECNWIKMSFMECARRDSVVMVHENTSRCDFCKGFSKMSVFNHFRDQKALKSLNFHKNHLILLMKSDARTTYNNQTSHMASNILLSFLLILTKSVLECLNWL